MIVGKAYYVGIHRYSFKTGKPAEIIGVGIVTPDKGRSRLCYHIIWADDQSEDWVPIDDTANYKIISFDDILLGKIPDVTE